MIFWWNALAGNHAAFDELVRRTSRLLFARLMLETGDSHQAEDLLQETLLTAYRTLGQLSEVSKFRSWLLRIAQNLAIDAARRDARKKRTPTVVSLRQQEKRPDEAAEQAELRERLLAALRGLPEYRLPLTLRYLVGADYDDPATDGLDERFAACLNINDPVLVSERSF